MHFFKKIFTDKNNKEDEALEYIKTHKKRLISNYFEGKKPIPSAEESLAIFMAGSPGAGKTEFSKYFISLLSSNLAQTFIRIDADEIRDFLREPGLYNGANSDDVQRAAVKGVEILFDYASKHNFNFILDGTFANKSVGDKNIQRILNKPNRNIEIWLIYQNPLIAWDFTKKREALEGRRVLKNVFKNAFINCPKNVDYIKLTYPQIKLHLAIKNLNNIGVEKYYKNVSEVELFLDSLYNERNLLDKII